MWEGLDPEFARSKLIAAGLYLVAYEFLLDAIKRHPLAFFANRWDSNGPKQSDSYKSEILGRDPKGKNDQLRGSIAFLRYMDAIDENDEATIARVTNERNRIAHELSEMIYNNDEPEFLSSYPILVQLVSKIEKWWIINVELQAYEELAGADIDQDNVTPGTIIALDFLAKTVLGEGNEASALHQSLKEVWPTLQ